MADNPEIISITVDDLAKMMEQATFRGITQAMTQHLPRNTELLPRRHSENHNLRRKTKKRKIIARKLIDDFEPIQSTQQQSTISGLQEISMPKWKRVR
ncbi:MAG TPA: hypothetical protein PKV97_00345 [Thauera aminoaromatica]|nr:hypothetical protein [Thauera aminoaromatica]